MAGSETEFFYSLDPQRILDSVEKAGHPCTGRIFPLNSMENRVYEIERDIDPASIRTPADRFLVGKFYRPGRWNREQILEEHQFLKESAANDIPVIAPLCDEAGRSLYEVPEQGILYALFPKQGGRLEPELSNDDLKRMGRLIARLHNVGGSHPADHRIRLDVQTYGYANIQFLKESGLLPKDFIEVYVRYASMACDTFAPLFSGVKYQRIHGDCHVGNILWASAGPALVDFDDMVMGPPVQDLWLLIPGRDEESKRKLEALVDGYEQMRDFDRSTLRLIEPLRTLRMIHFSAWIGRRWEDPAFKHVFPNYGSEEYWREQIGLLSEQLEVIQGG